MAGAEMIVSSHCRRVFLAVANEASWLSARNVKPLLQAFDDGAQGVLAATPFGDTGVEACNLPIGRNTKIVIWNNSYMHGIFAVWSRTQFREHHKFKFGLRHFRLFHLIALGCSGNG